MKYRIIKDGNLYFSQKKQFFWWRNMDQLGHINIEAAQYSIEFDCRQLDRKIIIKEINIK